MWFRAVPLLLLGACGPAAAPQTTGVIEITHTDFYNSATTRIFADGRIVQTTAAQGQVPVEEVTEGSPRAFAAAASLLQTEGRRVKATADTLRTCKSYGTDLIRATPPVGGFGEVATFCADEAVTGLSDRLYAVLGVTYDR